MTPDDRRHARDLAEFTAADLLGLYGVSLLLGGARLPESAPRRVWAFYERIALWTPASPAPAPRPRNV